MPYTVKDEDLPRVIGSLRYSAAHLRRVAGELSEGPLKCISLAQQYGSSATDCERLANEMEAEG